LCGGTTIYSPVKGNVPVKGTFGFFHFGAVMNAAAVNTYAQVFALMSILRSGTSGSYDSKCVYL
jgi:hypothetical protein